MKIITRKKNKYNLKNKKKGYSLVEMLVSLGIVGIIITMFFSILVISIRVSFKSLSRSAIREEISSVSLSILRDLRNADSITGCTESATRCEFTTETRSVVWELCETSSICRREYNGQEFVQTFKTSDTILVNSFTFDSGFGSNQTDTGRNILLTIIASHSNPTLNITNVIRQTTISTRNYEL